MLSRPRPGSGPAPARPWRGPVASPRQISESPAAPGARAMFREHESDRDHGRSPRSGQAQDSVFSPWILITEHRSRAPRPDPGAERVSPLSNQGSLSTSHTARDIAGLQYRRCDMDVALSGVRLFSQEGSRVRAGGFPHLGELTGLYDDNSPSCGNAPPGTREPSTVRTRPSRARHHPACSPRKSHTQVTLPGLPGPSRRGHDPNASYATASMTCVNLRDHVLGHDHGD